MSRHRAPCGRLSESAQSQHSRCSLNAALQHRKQSLVRGAAERGLKSRLRPSLPFPSTQPLLQTRHSSRIVACARYATSNSIPLTGSVPRKLPFAESTVGSGGGGYRWKCGHSPHRSLCAGLTHLRHCAAFRQKRLWIVFNFILWDYCDWRDSAPWHWARRSNLVESCRKYTCWFGYRPMRQHLTLPRNGQGSGSLRHLRLRAPCTRRAEPPMTACSGTSQ